MTLSDPPPTLASRREPNKHGLEFQRIGARGMMMLSVPARPNPRIFVETQTRKT